MFRTWHARHTYIRSTILFLAGKLPPAFSSELTMCSSAMLKARCRAHLFQTHPILSDYPALCARELPPLYRDAHVTAVAAPESRQLLVVLGDSALKTNRSRSGSKCLEACTLYESLGDGHKEYSLLVAIWPGCSLENLVDMAEAIAGITNIGRLVLVWQGNAYENMSLAEIPPYAPEDTFHQGKPKTRSLAQPARYGPMRSCNNSLTGSAPESARCWRAA